MTVLTDALADPHSSARLQAVMAAGSTPDPADLEVLVAQCAVEPDFFVRDMLTWALTRHPADVVVARVLPELERPEPQARSQALHTLSKIGDPDTWPAVRPLLEDRDDEVLRAAWRTAVALVPDDERASLARTLAVHLGIGDRERRLSLSRALVGLGEDTVGPVLVAAADRGTDAVREHVHETERLLHDPDAASALALERARREVALGRTRSVKG
ncbi:HEAT repeat domain-containing protein [Curtobacterium sp. MCPF17_021]|uniref:HEAT repeat domain-containing protein n=1 Tax=Curtobacterium sp. MCPF17_021 TaxID=2175639 RepID=UPI000DA80095|nr:HEAT repeat domain-containing protein [Curtobacterium sp. MCPF17_021]WIE83816.1 HEAT repeat domain-containing protein [Curtobacterium sp. MCPF17_021]